MIGIVFDTEMYSWLCSYVLDSQLILVHSFQCTANCVVWNKIYLHTNDYTCYKYVGKKADNTKSA